MHWNDPIRAEKKWCTLPLFVLPAFCLPWHCTRRADFIHSHQPRRPLSLQQFHHLNPDWPRAIPHNTLRESRHTQTQVHTHTHAQLFVLFCLQTHTHTGTYKQSILTRGDFLCREIENQLGWTLTLGDADCLHQSTHLHTHKHTNASMHILPIWLVKSLMAYSSGSLSGVNEGFCAHSSSTELSPIRTCQSQLPRSLQPDSTAPPPPPHRASRPRF